MRKLLAFMIIVVLTVSTFNTTRVSASGFSDVPANHGFYNEIMYLVDEGVVTLTKTFGVDQKVTREEVAVMVSKAVGLSGGKTKTPFKDVPSTSASSGYIKSAVDAGVLSGFTDGTFRPKQIVNRGEMAIFLAKAFKLTAESSTKFKDMSPSMASYSSVKKIVEAKITTGFSDGTFRPSQTLTRGQISAFLARAMVNGNGNESGIPSPTQPTQPTIPTQPSPELIPVLGDIALGMSKEQVMNLSEGYYNGESGSDLYYSDEYGYEAEIAYEFENNKLVAVSLFPYILMEQSDYTILETFFILMYEELELSFGVADVLDTDWFDDEEGYSLNAYWRTSFHDVLLRVAVSYDTGTYGAIRISAF